MVESDRCSMDWLLGQWWFGMWVFIELQLGENKLREITTDGMGFSAIVSSNN